MRKKYYSSNNNFSYICKKSYSRNYNEKNKEFIERKSGSREPKILISSAIFKGNGESAFLIDSGSTLSFIKKSKLRNNVKIDYTNKISVNGLPVRNITTLGTVFINIANKKCTLHILDDNDTNLKYDGILGRDFTHATDCDILLSKNCLRIKDIYVPFMIDPIMTIPARSKQLLSINIKNFEQKEGLVNKLNVGQGVYIGNALVKNDYGKAHIYAINTNEYDVKITLQNINLKNFEIVNKPEIPDFDTKILDNNSDEYLVLVFLHKYSLTTLRKIRKLHVVKKLKNL